MDPAPAERVAALDLIRGVAVLGILAINIAGFAGPPAAVLTPDIPSPATLADKIAYAAGFVLFEGKMRALFAILFGASMSLFIERADAAGRHGDLLQLRRLLWLMLFGALHFYLLWWGDILFTYALIGIAALLLRELSPRALVVAALTIFTGWSLIGSAMSLPDVAMEERVRTGTATQQEVAREARYRSLVEAKAAKELALYRKGFVEQVATRAADRPLQPLVGALDSAGEVLPYMLLGIALYASGFFSGGWCPDKVRTMAVWGTATGLALTMVMLDWSWRRDFPIQAMTALLIHGTAIPHLLMALGYAALLVLAAPRLARSMIGMRLIAAGRMAFSNYLGTTIVMTTLFYGWGFGLVGRFGHAAQQLFVLLGWLLMLWWSKPWLSRFRRGPLEWVWRSLTEWRVLANRR